MNAREKASELIVNYQLQCKSLDYQQAKQCALIAVDEIINSNPHSNPLNTNVYSTMSYWQEVKQEINLL